MKLTKSKLKNIILKEVNALLSDSENKLPDFLYKELEDEIKNSQFWKYSNTEDESDIYKTPGGWQNQTESAKMLQDTIREFLYKNNIKVDIAIISAESEGNEALDLPVTKKHRLYPNSLVVGGQQAVDKRGRFVMYLFMVPVAPDFNPLDVDPNILSRKIANMVRHEIIHAIQIEKRRKNQKISRLAAKDKFEKSGEIPDSEDRQAYLSSKIEIDAYAHELAEEILQKYGKEKSLSFLRGDIPLEDLDLSDQFIEYIKEVPGKKSTDRLKSKIYKHIINLSKRGIYSEVKKKKSKKSGSEPEETYQKATKKNLYLDKDTQHGGWPEGPSKSFTSNKPVNDQIYTWLKIFAR